MCDMEETQYRACKKIDFQLVLWQSSYHILLVRGHCLLVLINDVVRGWPAWTTLAQLAASKLLKSYFPSKKIYLSLTTGKDLFRALIIGQTTFQGFSSTYVYSLGGIQNWEKLNNVTVVKRQWLCLFYLVLQRPNSPFRSW